MFYDVGTNKPCTIPSHCQELLTSSLLYRLIRKREKGPSCHASAESASFSSPLLDETMRTFLLFGRVEWGLVKESEAGLFCRASSILARPHCLSWTDSTVEHHDRSSRNSSFDSQAYKGIRKLWDSSLQPIFEFQWKQLTTAPV